MREREWIMRIEREREMTRVREEEVRQERERMDMREILSTNVDLESLCIPNGRKNPNRFYYLDRE